MALYSYPTRLLEPDSIRLLSLFPATDQAEPIRCQLVDYSLSSRGSGPHRYECLSYVWGTKTSLLPIYIGERQEPLDVTENLHDALLQLRDHMFERLIWVDAVCINQACTDERSQQVQFMARIYGCAQRVVVWLGNESHNSNLALQFIRNAAGRKETTGSTTSEKPNCTKLAEARNSAVLSLLERPWFRRVWVLQEVAAARDVLIKCRPEEINGFIFCVGLQSLDMNCDDLPKFQIGVRSIVSFMRKAALSNESKGELCLRLDPLERLVNMFHTHGATDPRDRVFALLGMSTDLPPTCGLQADYRIDWTTLFLNLVKFMFGKDVQATINRRNDTAMIHTSGHLLGKIVAAGRGTAWGDDQTITLRASNPFRYFTTSADNGDSSSLVRQVLRLTVPSGGKCIAKDDILCYLPSVERVVVLRRQDAAFHIIALFSSLPSHDDWDTDWFQHWSNAMELWMIWGWESVPTYHVARTLTNAREPRNSEIEVSLIATAQILDYLGDYHGAKTAIGAYRLLHPDDPRIATFQDFEKSVQRKASLLSEAQRVLDRLSRHPFKLGWLAETLARLHGIPERYDASDSISPWGSINQIQSEFLAQYMVSSNDHELADKVVENYHSAVLSYQVQLGKNPELIERLFCAAIAQPNLHNTTPDRILTLLERYDKPFRDVERMLKIAVRNASMNAEEELIKVISYLLQRAGDNFHVSEDLLAAAAAMETSGIIEIIDLFLDHVHEDCIGSLTVLEVMARNRTQGEKLFTFLDKRYGSKFVVPQYIAQEAMYRGIDMMTALPSKRRTDFFLFPFPSGAVDNFSPR